MRRSTSVSTGRFFHSSYVILDKDFTPFPGLELFLVRAFFPRPPRPAKDVPSVPGVDRYVAAVVVFGIFGGSRVSMAMLCRRRSFAFSAV
jgi:hypothetical protein